MDVLIGSAWIFRLIAATRSKTLAEGEMGDDESSACHRTSCPSHPIVTCPSVIVYWIHKFLRTHTISYKPPNSLLYALMVKLHPGTSRLPSILRCLEEPRVAHIQLHHCLCLLDMTRHSLLVPCRHVLPVPHRRRHRAS
eukprot:scaffold368430_cov59-Attheya_sp.AAC.8